MKEQYIILIVVCVIISVIGIVLGVLFGVILHKHEKITKQHKYKCQYNSELNHHVCQIDDENGTCSKFNCCRFSLTNNNTCKWDCKGKYIDQSRCEQTTNQYYTIENNQCVKTDKVTQYVNDPCCHNFCNKNSTIVIPVKQLTVLNSGTYIEKLNPVVNLYTGFGYTIASRMVDSSTVQFVVPTWDDKSNQMFVVYNAKFDGKSLHTITSNSSYKTNSSQFSVTTAPYSIQFGNDGKTFAYAVHEQDNANKYIYTAYRVIKPSNSIGSQLIYGATSASGSSYTLANSQTHQSFYYGREDTHKIYLRHSIPTNDIFVMDYPYDIFDSVCVTNSANNDVVFISTTTKNKIAMITSDGLGNDIGYIYSSTFIQSTLPYQSISNLGRVVACSNNALYLIIGGSNGFVVTKKQNTLEPNSLLWKYKTVAEPQQDNLVTVNISSDSNVIAWISESLFQNKLHVARFKDDKLVSTELIVPSIRDSEIGINNCLDILLTNSNTYVIICSSKQKSKEAIFYCSIKLV